MEWYDYVKVLMKHKGVTQEDLMPVFGVKTRGAVGHYLLGRREPSLKQIKAVAAHLNVSIASLVDSENEASLMEGAYYDELNNISSTLTPDSKSKLMDMAELLRSAERVNLERKQGGEPH